MSICRASIRAVWRPEPAMRRDMRGYVADSGTFGEKCLGNGVAVRDGKDANAWRGCRGFRARLGCRERLEQRGLRLQAKPGEEGRLLVELNAMIEPSEAEAGCLGYRPLQDPNDEGAMVIVERWIDDAALAVHFQTPHFKHVAAVLDEILAEPFTLTRLTPVAASAP